MSRETREAIEALIRAHGGRLDRVSDAAIRAWDGVIAAVRVECEAEVRRATGEALNSGDGSYRP